MLTRHYYWRIASIGGAVSPATTLTLHNIFNSSVPYWLNAKKNYTLAVCKNFFIHFFCFESLQAWLPSKGKFDWNELQLIRANSFYGKYFANPCVGQDRCIKLQFSIECSIGYRVFECMSWDNSIRCICLFVETDLAPKGFSFICFFRVKFGPKYGCIDIDADAKLKNIDVNFMYAFAVRFFAWDMDQFNVKCHFSVRDDIVLLFGHFFVTNKKKCLVVWRRW